MILARIEFRSDCAIKFVDSPNGQQSVIEQEFESIDALIEVIREFEPFIKDCIANVDGKIIQLSAFKTR
jgi:hypothetical protein